MLVLGRRSLAWLLCPDVWPVGTGDKKSPKEQGEVEGMLGQLGYKPQHIYKF